MIQCLDWILTIFRYFKIVFFLIEGQSIKMFIDTQGIQALYGKKTTGGGYNPAPAPKPQPQPKPNVPSDNNEMCTNPKIDTIFNTHDGSTYAFKGNNYYKLTENAIAEGYPKLISDGWPGLPG